MRPLLDLLDLLWPRHCLACGDLVRAGDDASAASAASGVIGGVGGVGAIGGVGAVGAIGAVATIGAIGAPPLGLCSACRGRLVAIDPRASCATCARPLPPLPAPLPGAGPQHHDSRRSGLQYCGRCLADPPEFARLTALWRYQTPLKEVVQAFKFGRLDFLGRHLARGLARAFAERQDTEAGWEPPDLVVPVPLPWPRRLARGFNQTELLAWPLAREWGRPCPRALTRRFFAPRQTGQRRGGRARAAHFRVPDAAAVAGRSILLVDDVLTTGATVRGASAALRRAGARRVEVAVVGWTPLETSSVPAPGATADPGPGPDPTLRGGN
jgi:ComF family protein